jgi:site-specific DNA recombinase
LTVAIRPLFRYVRFMPTRMVIMQQGSRNRSCGATRNAVMYSRVSSKDQEREGFSIPAQECLLRGYANQRGLVVVREFVDVETAKESGRPGFAAMLAYLKAHRQQCRTLLVEKTDRLYRNLKDYSLIDDLDVELHFVKENVVISKNSRSSDKLLHGIRTVLAKNYIDNLSEEVKKGLRAKAELHLWPSFAPLGYLNTIGPDGKRIIVPDPVLGPMVTQLFEWFATRNYSLKSLAQKAYQEGFRFRKTNHKVPVTTLHKMLRKRVYTGAFDYAGVRYSGSHQPLVTRETWERVQEILDGRHEKKHRKVRHDFAFSGLVSCGHCGCSMVGELKKGRYVYYHCTGYRGRCHEPYTREEALTRQFADHLSELVIPSAVLTWLREEIAESDHSEVAAREQTERRHQAEIERLQRRLDTLYDDRLDGRIDAPTYDLRAAETRQLLDRFRQRLDDLAKTALPPVRQAVDLMALTSRTTELFRRQVGVEQRKLLHLILEGASWQGGELRISLKEPFAQLRLSNRATTCKDGSFGLDSGVLGIWRRERDSNP